MLSKRGEQYASSGVMKGAGYASLERPEYNRLSNPNGEVSFSMAENFLMQDKIFNYINTHSIFTPQAITYNEGPCGPLRLRKAMAAHINDYFHPRNPVLAEHVTFTAGVTGLNEMVTFNIVDEGEGILLGKPIYGSFYEDLGMKTKSKLIYTSFGSIDQFSLQCVSEYEKAILKAENDGIKVKALLLCNPHNPLGKCYSVEVLKALMQLCEKYDLHLISDEIYALSVFKVNEEERTGFTSVLSIECKGLLAENKIHILYGLAKDFGAAGLRLGCLISRNQQLNEATRAIGRFNWPSEFSCQIATTILEDRAFVAEYTAESCLGLARNYSIATKTLDDAKIDYVKDGNAGFFLWIDLSPFLPHREPDSEGWEAEAELKTKLLDSGVRMSSGLAYKSDYPGWFRVIFSVDEDSLEEALGRIVKTVRG